MSLVVRGKPKLERLVIVDTHHDTIVGSNERGGKVINPEPIFSFKRTLPSLWVPKECAKTIAQQEGLWQQYDRMYFVYSGEVVEGDFKTFDVQFFKYI